MTKYHPTMAVAAAAVQSASNQLYHVQLPNGAQVPTAGPLLQPFGDSRMRASIISDVPEATRTKMDRVPATPDIGDEHVRRISEDAGAFHCIDCSFVGADKEMLKAHTQHVHPVGDVKQFGLKIGKIYSKFKSLSTDATLLKVHYSLAD